MLSRFWAMRRVKPLPSVGPSELTGVLGRPLSARVLEDAEAIAGPEVFVCGSVVPVLLAQVLLHCEAVPDMPCPGMRARWQEVFGALLHKCPRARDGRVIFDNDVVSVFSIALRYMAHVPLQMLLQSGWQPSAAQAASLVARWASYTLYSRRSDVVMYNIRETIKRIAVGCPNCIVRGRPLCNISRSAADERASPWAAAELYYGIAVLIDNAVLSRAQWKDILTVHVNGASSHTLLGRLVEGANAPGRPHSAVDAALVAINSVMTASAIKGGGAVMMGSFLMLKGSNDSLGLARAIAAIVLNIGTVCPDYKASMKVAYGFWIANAEGRSLGELCVTVGACIDMCDGTDFEPAHLFELKDSPELRYNLGPVTIQLLLEHQDMRTCLATKLLLAVMINRAQGWNAVPRGRSTEWEKAVGDIAAYNPRVALLVFRRMCTSPAAAWSEHRWSPVLHEVMLRCDGGFKTSLVGRTVRAIFMCLGSHFRQALPTLPSELIAIIVAETLRGWDTPPKKGPLFCK